MEGFKSVNDLVWWIQNNGGGSVEIEISASISLQAVQIKVRDSDGNFRSAGCGRFLKEAVNRMEGA